MRALSLALTCAAALLAAPAIAHPQPPPGGGCPGARPGEEVLYCEFQPYPQPGWGNGAYDAGGLREWRYDGDERWSDEDARGEDWSGPIERRGYIDLDEFMRSHAAEFWGEEQGADGWSEHARDRRGLHDKAWQ